jgi:hypothetical protein
MKDRQQADGTSLMNDMIVRRQRDYLAGVK